MVSQPHADTGNGVLALRKDWLCGTCSNLNSANRVICYRCGASLEDAKLRRSCEVRVRTVPETVELEDVAKAVWRLLTAPAPYANESITSEHADPPIIVDVKRGSSTVLSTAESVLRGLRQAASVTLDPPASVADVFVRFNSKEAAAQFLQAAHCSLAMKAARGSPFSLCFGSGRHTSDSDASHWKSLCIPADTGDATSSSTLPPDLAVLPQSFASEEDEKLYLERMAGHWGLLSDDHKSFYNDKVKAALARSTAPTPVSTSSPVPPTSTTAASSTTMNPTAQLSTPAVASSTTAAAPTAKPQSLSAIKAALAMRKAAQSAASSSTSTPPVSSPSVTPSNAARTAGVAAAGTTTPSSPSLPVKGGHVSLGQVKAALAARRMSDSASTVSGSPQAPTPPAATTPGTTPNVDEVENVVLPCETIFGFSLPPGVRKEKPTESSFRVSLPIARRLLSHIPETSSSFTS